MSIRREQRRDLIKLSAFLTFAGLVTVWIGIVTGDVQAGDSHEYSARFSDVSGLQPGDQVRVAGVTVGKVNDIDVQPDASVLVRFDVQERLQLATTTTATVRYRNLIGDRLLELDRGSRVGEALAPGAVIDIARTAAAVDLDTLLNGFKPLFAGLNPQQVNELSGQLVQVLQGKGTAVEHLVRSVGSFTTTLANRADLVTQVVDNLSSVLGEVSSRKDELGRLVTELSDLVDGLNRQDTQVLDSATRISGFARSAADLIAGARGDLTPTLQGLEVTSRKLNGRADTLEALLDKWPGHYARIQDTASYGSFFNFYLCGLNVRLTDRDGQSTRGPVIHSDAERCRR